MSRGVWLYKKQAVRVAKELGYSPEVQKRLDKATSDAEIYRIMNNARRALLYTKKFKKSNLNLFQKAAESRRNREVLSDQHYIIRAKGRAKVLSANR